MTQKKIANCKDKFGIFIKENRIPPRKKSIIKVNTTNFIGQLRFCRKSLPRGNQAKLNKNRMAADNRKLVI